MLVSREAYEKARKFLGNPADCTEGRAIDPLFTMGLPVEAVPEDRREEYAKLLAIWKIQREEQKNWPLRNVQGKAHPFSLDYLIQN